MSIIKRGSDENNNIMSVVMQSLSSWILEDFQLKFIEEIISHISCNDKTFHIKASRRHGSSTMCLYISIALTLQENSNVFIIINSMRSLPVIYSMVKEFTSRLYINYDNIIQNIKIITPIEYTNNVTPTDNDILLFDHTLCENIGENNCITFIITHFDEKIDIHKSITEIKLNVY